MGIPGSRSSTRFCDDYSLSAVLNSPIIGVDENGNEIFPTGLVYPLAVNTPWSDGGGYVGTLSHTQYGYHWTFDPRLDGAVEWNGSVAWIGGRFEQTDIMRVTLVAVPEAIARTCLLFACVAIGVALRRLSGTVSSQELVDRLFV